MFAQSLHKFDICLHKVCYIFAQSLHSDLTYLLVVYVCHDAGIVHQYWHAITTYLIPHSAPASPLGARRRPGEAVAAAQWQPIKPQNNPRKNLKNSNHDIQYSVQYLGNKVE